MENLTFVQNVLIFLGLNGVALLCLNVKKHGKYLSFAATLIAAMVFFAMLFVLSQRSLGWYSYFI